MPDDPWTHAVTLTLAANTPTSNHVTGLLNDTIDDIGLGMDTLKQSILHSESSRRVTYRELNPDMSVHEMYCRRGHGNEVYRRAFSRLRVIGHSLAIETGRWNRRGRGRLEVAERLCPCGAVQTELHVLESCPLTQDVRTSYNFHSFNQLIRIDSQFPVAEIVYKILSYFQ